ncbi:hypothetical protein ECP03047993_5637 [Escherichia coli P0304799.3]|nr:hypothetical protein ECP03047993_5637 [Escherichia coli P0304799.3]
MDWLLFLLILVGGGNYPKQRSIVLQLASNCLILVLRIVWKNNSLMMEKVEIRMGKLFFI